MKEGASGGREGEGEGERGRRKKTALHTDTGSQVEERITSSFFFLLLSLSLLPSPFFPLTQISLPKAKKKAGRPDFVMAGKSKGGEEGEREEGRNFQLSPLSLFLSVRSCSGRGD